MSQASYSSIFGGPSNTGANHRSQSASSGAGLSDDDGFITDPSPQPGPSSDVAAESEPDVDEAADDDDEYFDIEEEEGLHDRPSRFQGSRQKWQRLTYAERSLAESMDRLEDDDLSIHLYDAHALKRRLYVHNQASQAQSEDRSQPMKKRELEQWRSKDRWIGDDGQTGTKPWYPSQHWTAWPLPPQAVPRPDERLKRNWHGNNKEEKSTVRQRDISRPIASSEMQDVLLAEVLRKARMKFDARPWASKQHVWPSRQPAKVRDRSKSRDLADDASDHNTRRRRQRNMSVLSDSGQQDAEIWLKRKGNYGKAGDHDIEAYLRPVVMADDDKARSLLQYPIRHVLSILDKLFMALHTSRLNQIGSERRPANEIDSPSKDRPVPETLRKGISKTSREQPERSTSMSQKRDDSATVDQARTRDWSEILGTAAMIGWDTKTIRRAATRCEHLFGEKMAFVELNDGPLKEVVDDSEMSHIGHSDAVREMFGGVHVDGFMRPIKRYTTRSRQGKKRGPYRATRMRGLSDASLSSDSDEDGGETSQQESSPNNTDDA